jgi:tetratricopeptide (TPR) repeat protein
VLMERGRLGEAAGAYQKMIDLKPFYQSYTRAAHLRWLKGDLTGAVTLMERAVASASPRDPESGAWANTRLSHYELQRGRLDEANRAAGAALAHVREYPAALLALGRVQLASGQTAEALDSLRRAVAHNPLPEYQWTLADALSAAGRDQEAAAVERELTASGERADPRTLALFLSTRVLRSSLSSVPGLPGQPVDASSGGHALGLARAEALERGDVFTLDAIAWAQLADGRVEDARQTIGRAVAEGTRDARLFLHAAVIAAASGHRADALRWSRQAHAIRFTLLPSELDLLDRSRTPRTFGTRGTPGTLGTR